MSGTLILAAGDAGERLRAAMEKRGDPATLSDTIPAGGSRPDAVVVLALPEPADRALVPLTALDEPTWLRVTDGAMLATVRAMQSAHAAFGDGGGAIVVVGPVVGLSGARGATALATLAEGQRALVKSAARQWGGRGITVNWVSVPTGLLAPELVDGSYPEGPELGAQRPALGRAPGIDDLAGTLAWLGSTAGRCLTGASLNLDGGEWMLP